MLVYAKFHPLNHLISRREIILKSKKRCGDLIFSIHHIFDCIFYVADNDRNIFRVKGAEIGGVTFVIPAGNAVSVGLVKRLLVVS